MAKFPVLFAGQRFTATLAGQMEPDYYRKTVTTTRASVITTLSDPDLSVPVDVGGIYIIEFYVKYAALLAAGLKTVWNVPAGTTGNRQAEGLAATNTTTISALDATPSGTAFSTRSGVHGFTTALGYGNRDSAANQVWLYEWAEVTVGGTAGAVALGWGQVASNATGSTVNAGSFARRTQIG